MTELSCPRCEQRAPAPETVPTFRRSSAEVLLVRWECPACGLCAVVEAGPGGTGIVALTPEVLLRVGAVDRALAAELAGPGLDVAGHLRPGWACAAARALAGRPAFRLPAAAESATAAAIERLRVVQWAPTTDDVQLGPVREHYDAVAAWVRSANRPDLWPDLQPPVLVRDDASLVQGAMHRLRAESWYADLPPDATTRADLVYWLVWLALDAAGEIPEALPDPYEPLVRAYEAGGVLLAGRELRGEVRLGLATLRIPPSVEAWPDRPLPPRRTLYPVRDC